MIALPIAAIVFSAIAVLLLFLRLIEQISSTLRPNVIHDPVTGDRSLTIACAIAFGLITVSPWFM